MRRKETNTFTSTKNIFFRRSVNWRQNVFVIILKEYDLSVFKQNEARVSLNKIVLDVFWKIAHLDEDIASEICRTLLYLNMSW